MSIPKKPLAVSRAKKKLPVELDWGPGVPKDRLAYINSDEKALIQRFRKTKAARDYAGVPAFADDSASSKGVSRGADGPSGVGRGSGSGAGTGTSKTSSSSPSSSTGGGNKSSSGSTSSSSASKSPSAASASPSKAPNAAAQAASNTYKAAQSASKAPATNTAASRAPNAAAAYASQKLNATSNALKTASQPTSIQSMINANTGNYPSRGDTPGTQKTDKYNVPNAYTDLNAVVHREMQDLRQPNAYVSNSPKSLNDFTMNQLHNFTGRSPSEIRNMAATTYGEYAGPNADERAAIANTMENRLGYGAKYGDYGFGPDIGKMLKGYDANGFDTTRPVPVGGNDPFNRALAGGSALSKGLMGSTDALDPYSGFHQTAPASVQSATHYLTNDAYSQAAKNQNHWVNEPSFQSSKTQYGSHLYGNAEPTAQRIADLRGIPTTAGSVGLAAATSPKVVSEPSAPGPQAIPSPISVGMMPNQQRDPAAARMAGNMQTPLGPPQLPNASTIVAGDPRVSMPPGSFPAARVSASVDAFRRSLAGTLTSPYNVTDAFGNPRNGTALPASIPGYTPPANPAPTGPSTYNPVSAPEDNPVYSDSPIQGPQNPMQEGPQVEDPGVRQARQNKYASTGATIGQILLGPAGALLGGTIGYQMGKTTPGQRQAIASSPQALQANVQSINQMAEERGGKGNPQMRVTETGLQDVLTNPGKVAQNPSKYTTLEQMLAALAQGIDPETGKPLA